MNEETKKLFDEFDALIQEGEKPWPQMGDAYFYNLQDGEVGYCEWEGDALDEGRLALGDCHRTPEQAVAAHQWRINPRTQARRMVEMCEGFDPSGAYVLGYDGTERNLKISAASCYWADGTFRFKPGVYMNTAVKKLGKPLIKVALGVITGEEAERIVREAMGK